MGSRHLQQGNLIMKLRNVETSEEKLDIQQTDTTAMEYISGIIIHSQVKFKFCNNVLISSLFP